MQNLLDLVNSLNPMQRSAVELPAEHALILAGAGSGKTRVLTTRIAWIIAKGMARPAQILAVTFTNKAAREMRDRLEGMVNADMRSMWVGTFHGIAHKLLRLHCEDAGLPSTFQIIDSSDQLALIRKQTMPRAGRPASTALRKRGCVPRTLPPKKNPWEVRAFTASTRTAARKRGLWILPNFF